MNIEFDFITPFYLGAKDIFEQMFKSQVNVSQINHIETNVTLDDITVDLELKSNNFTGKVYYFMSKGFVTNILSVMMGFMTELDMNSEMTKSALLELNNMITGRALTKLAEMGTNYNMSVPEIILGKGSKMSEGNISLSLVTLESSGASFTIGFLTSSVEKLVKPTYLPRETTVPSVPATPVKQEIPAPVVTEQKNEAVSSDSVSTDNKALLNQFKEITLNSIKEIKNIKGDNEQLLKKGEISIKMAKNSLKSKKIMQYDNSMDTITEVKQLLSLTLDELKVSKGDSDYIIRKNDIVADLAKVMLDVLLELVD